MVVLLAVGGSLLLPGEAQAVDRPYHVKLPYPAGGAYQLTQGNHGRFTHCSGPRCVWGEEYAFDFALGDTEPVAAAHGGIVAHVRDDKPSGNCGAAYANEANYMVIDHGDGTSALYLHLLQHSAKFTEGHPVGQGQVIGLADHSGWTCNGAGGPAPHLHFQVQTAPCHGEGVYCRSIPAYFDDLGLDGSALTEISVKYTSGNDRAVDWRNTDYQANCGFPAEHLVHVAIHDGAGQVPKEGGVTGSTYEVGVAATAVGDLDGDRLPETAVVLFCHASDTSPNFVIWDVQVFSANAALLGRIVVPDDPYYKATFANNELWISDGLVKVGVDYRDCGACEPSAHRVLSWRWDGRTLRPA